MDNGTGLSYHSDELGRKTIWRKCKNASVFSVALIYGILTVIMDCIIKTTNPVRLNYLQSLLAAEKIPHTVFDMHISALEAGIGIFPRRLMVPDAYRHAAIALLQDVDEYYDD